MERIALHIPAKDRNNRINGAIYSTPLAVAIVAIACFIAKKENGTSQLEPSHHHDDDGAPPPQSSSSWAKFILFIALLFILYTSIVELKSRHRLIGYRGPRFIEAAVEITPLGVQLVSIYGTSHTSTLLLESSDISRKIRVFIPRQQLLDVIVMEVVWPHCVWSQVVFRVIRGEVQYNSTISGYGENVKEADGGMEKGTNNQRLLGGCKCEMKHQHDQRTSDSQHKASQQPLLQKNRHDVQKLLQQNRLTIIPLFPEECQGMLTYKQCLDVQEEIERRIGLK